jgi:hypothetical protein
MTGKWEVITIEINGKYTRVNLFKPGGYAVNYGINDFMRENYPSAKAEEKFKCAELIASLLEDGWEPLNAATAVNAGSLSSNLVLCLRKIVD